jgi:hypothetical protein
MKRLPLIFIRWKAYKIMAIIHKKVWPKYFEEIISGQKKFELRLADFEINKGDTLVLEEWDNNKKEYTGRKVEVVATYILKTKSQTFWPKEDVDKYGFQIIQFRKMKMKIKNNKCVPAHTGGVISCANLYQ